MTDWTKGSDGQFIRWDQEPHYVNCVLNLLLPGEDRLPDKELSKRRREYMKLRRRAMRSGLTTNS